MPSRAAPDYATLLRRYRRQRRLTFVAIVAILVLCWALIAKDHPATSDDDYSRYHGRTFKCVKVVDGDTIDVNVADLKAPKPQAYTRLRLWGIDTPELPHFGKPAMYYGYDAAEFARKLLQGKQVKLELIAGRTRGRFARVLAYVYLPDGRLYNRQAVEQGYAYAEKRPQYAHPLTGDFDACEARARKRLRGLWAGIEKDQLPKWYPRTVFADFVAHRRAKQKLHPPVSASTTPATTR